MQRSRPLSPRSAATYLCVAGLHALLSAAAVGQPAQAPGANPDQLQEIIVTAEKRNERVQDTPISLTAISGAELQAQGVTDLADAARQIPGVAQITVGPGQTDYTIRGLSSYGTTISTVGFYLDDVPMTAPSGSQNGHVVIDPDLYDLNRVEVLRGPQGTLYGSGSMGGTIKLVTNQPDVSAFAANTKFDGSGTQGGGLNGAVNAMVNIPLIEGTLALRIVGTDEHTSGSIDRDVVSNFPLPTNPQPQCPGFTGCTRGNVLAEPVSARYSDVNDEDLKGLRASVRYQANDQLSVTATAFTQQIRQDGLSYFDNPPGTDVHYQPFDVPEPFSDTFHLYNAVIDWASPVVDITSVSSYWTRSQSQTQDQSETIQTGFGFPSFTEQGGGVGPLSLTEVDYTKQFSEEIRLTSVGDTALQWLVGGFYSNYTYDQLEYSFAQGLIPYFGTDNLLDGTEHFPIKQTAEFGEISYKLANGIKATAGLRHYSYTQSGSVTQDGIVTASLTTPYTVYTAADNSGFNPKFTLSYEANDELMVYGTAAKGFRPGGGTAPIPTTGPDSCLSDLQAIGLSTSPTQYGPDTVWSYELGEKATLLDRRLTINSAIYYERWNKVQQAVGLACGYRFVDNVGTAAIRGGEVEFDFKVSQSWTVAQTVGYTHAILTGTAAETGVAVGSTLLNVPNNSESTSIIYTHPVAAGYDLIARTSNVHVGSQQDQSYFLETLPGYDIANFRVGVATPHWSASCSSIILPTSGQNSPLLTTTERTFLPWTE